MINPEKRVVSEIGKPIDLRPADNNSPTISKRKKVAA